MSLRKEQGSILVVIIYRYCQHLAQFIHGILPQESVHAMHFCLKNYTMTVVPMCCMIAEIEKIWKYIGYMTMPSYSI
jgi:hypothetical protein